MDIREGIGATGSPGIPVKKDAKSVGDGNGSCGYAVRPYRDDALLYFFHGILEGDISQAELICAVKRDKHVLCDAQ